jgi:hypothetical protein
MADKPVLIISLRGSVMRTMLILLFIALLTFYTSIAHAQENNTRGIHSNEVIDEVVVVGPSRCGSWPIEHQSLRGCEFAELKKEDLPKVLDLRRKLVSDCLICQGNQCTIKAWPEYRITEKLLCKRLFWTPTRVSNFMYPLARYSPLRVSYTFKISTDGRVEDIELISFDGDIEEEELLQLIAHGAARTRFEPIVVAEVAYELVGLRDTFIRP